MIEIPPNYQGGKKQRIVVLDDEVGGRQSCIDMFRYFWAHSVELFDFADAQKAWQELSRADPDLFITDIKHPGMTCEEMLTRLAERKVKYPVLIVSASLGYASEGREYSGSAADVQRVQRDWRPNLNVYFLPKPYDKNEFRKVLETALNISSVLDGSVAEPPTVITHASR
jgi:DNA-binding NtrC family response regulator